MFHGAIGAAIFGAITAIIALAVTTIVFKLLKTQNPKESKLYYPLVILVFTVSYTARYLILGYWNIK